MSSTPYRTRTCTQHVSRILAQDSFWCVQPKRRVIVIRTPCLPRCSHLHDDRHTHNNFCIFHSHIHLSFHVHKVITFNTANCTIRSGKTSMVVLPSTSTYRLRAQPLTTQLLPTTVYNPTNTISRRSSIRSQTFTDNARSITLCTIHSREPRSECPASPLQQWRLEESDARASVYHSEREDRPPTSLVCTGLVQSSPCPPPSSLVVLFLSACC